MNEPQDLNAATGGLTDLLGCPFCGCEMHIKSTSDWHYLYGNHTDSCMFEPTPEETAMVPATKEQFAFLVTDWNTRHNAKLTSPPLDKL